MHCSRRAWRHSSHLMIVGTCRMHACVALHPWARALHTRCPSTDIHTRARASRCPVPGTRCMYGLDGCAWVFLGGPSPLFLGMFFSLFNTLAQMRHPGVPLPTNRAGPTKLRI